MNKRVAILTGGGDVPGLNMCLKSLVYRLIDLGYEPIGVRKGWEGLIRYNPQDPSTYSENFIELTKNMVRSIDRTPGSFLHSCRLDPRQTPDEVIPELRRRPDGKAQDLTDYVMKVVQHLAYDALIVIGDEDTLQFAAHLSAQGAPVIGIPKTIHNNIHGTDYTLGFSTGLARGVAFVHELRALAGSREQILVIETFAARSGYSTLLMGILAGVDRVIIPEAPYNPERLAQLVLQDQHQNPANYAIVLATDGSQPEAEQAVKYAALISPAGKAHAFSSGQTAARLLSHLTGREVFSQPLTYLLRTGSPDGQDLLGAVNFAFLAAELTQKGQYGRMAAFVKDQMWTDVGLEQALQGSRTVNLETMYDQLIYKPNLSLIWAMDDE